MKTRRGFWLLILALQLMGTVSASGQRNAAQWRSLADSSVTKKDFPAAARAYREAANRYRQMGDFGAYKVLLTQAERYETQGVLFQERLLTRKAAQSYYTGKRLEPYYGVYLGAFIDREDNLSKSYQDENFQTHRSSAEWNQILGKKHAVFFMYQRYGTKFPGKWMEHLRQNKAAAHWVLSPENLNAVQNDQYLMNLAFAAAKAKIPIFVRFAGEMNGDWTPYHNNPALYIQKFRIVAEMFHAYAPNVAMVWCPNDVPEDKITRYYPGEDWVDWVGVNFYSVPFNDADRSRPARWRNPADSLRFIYNTYAKKHPIMIGETAASHLSIVDNRPCPEFAVDKIGQLYSSLPHLYPRVKAIHWLSMNTLRHARAERQLNNYALLDSPDVIAQYRELTGHPHFLEEVETDRPAAAPIETVRLTNGATFSGLATFSAWVKSYEQRPIVRFLVDGKIAERFDLPGHYRWQLDTKRFPNGPHSITLEVRDGRGTLAGKQTVPVKFAN